MPKGLKITLWILGGLVLLGGISFAVYYFFIKDKGTTNGNNTTDEICVNLIDKAQLIIDRRTKQNRVSQINEFENNGQLSQTLIEERRRLINEIALIDIKLNKPNCA